MAFLTIWIIYTEMLWEGIRICCKPWIFWQLLEKATIRFSWQLSSAAGLTDSISLKYMLHGSWWAAGLTAGFDILWWIPEGTLQMKLWLEVSAKRVWELTVNISNVLIRLKKHDQMVPEQDVFIEVRCIVGLPLHE